jgi:hypothetical protein
MTVDLLVTCGDSFACGSGLPDEDAFEKSYAGLTAKDIGVEQKVLARPGCCNYIIFLQIKWAVENLTQANKPFVLITMTNAARTAWYKPFQNKRSGVPPSIEHLNYQDYPPYDTHTNRTMRRPIPVQTDNSLQSETLTNLDTFLDEGAVASWIQFSHEPQARIKVLRDWVADFFNFEIKNDYDNGILAQGHLLLKKHNIPHLFMGWQPQFGDLLPEENYVAVDWGYWSQNYPDDRGTGHCDYRGHDLVYKEIIKKVKAQVND